MLHRAALEPERAEPCVQDLAKANQVYAFKFNHTFITCATGKSAKFMLGELHWRCARPFLEVVCQADVGK